jgi:hypothetical protein
MLKYDYQSGGSGSLKLHGFFSQTLSGLEKKTVNWREWGK